MLNLKVWEAQPILCKSVFSSSLTIIKKQGRGKSHTLGIQHAQLADTACTDHWPEGEAFTNLFHLLGCHRAEVGEDCEIKMTHALK
jgi:hypothetical protein